MTIDIDNPLFWRPTDRQQVRCKFNFGLSANNENKDAFGEVITKDEALKILKSRSIHFMTLEYIRNSDVQEVRAYAKPWDPTAEKQLYFFGE
ncbi:hypothetical protein [Paraburkholderia aromaticivorans]|uniref:hypothetical protein n=1 Tax=Paraburkholderia aromaticivorans TaxID=2026199 RepID=UPI0038B71DEE